MTGEPPDAQPQDPEQPPPQQATPAPQHMVLCRRCQRFSPAGLGHCLFCRAPSRNPEAAQAAIREFNENQETGNRVSALFWIFGVMLAVNVGLFWYFRGDAHESTVSEATVRNCATALTFAEAVDSILVVLVFLKLRNEIPPVAGMGGRQRMGWAIAAPFLAVLLAANVGYHWILMTLAGVQAETDQMLSSGHHQYWLLALYCIQPAIIEEIFCRRLAFDFFAHHTSVGTAAFASAAMFAAMHTGALISFPYFVLFGIVMAWLRWWSGSLVLPMLAHFLHNLLISAYDMATA